jgi:hypothetical protein
MGIDHACVQLVETKSAVQIAISYLQSLVKRYRTKLALLLLDSFINSKLFFLEVQ